MNIKIEVILSERKPNKEYDDTICEFNIILDSSKTGYLDTVAAIIHLLRSNVNILEGGRID